MTKKTTKGQRTILTQLSIAKLCLDAIPMINRREFENLGPLGFFTDAAFDICEAEKAIRVSKILNLSLPLLGRFGYPVPSAAY